MYLLLYSAGEKLDFVSPATETKFILLHLDLNAANFQSYNPIQNIILLVPQWRFPWHWAAGLMPEIHMGHKEMVSSTHYRKLEENSFHGNYICWVSH